MDDDSPVRATSDSICGRAMSHRPRELTYAMPRLSTFGVSSKTPSPDLTKPSSSRVSSSRRAVGRARPVAVATSLSDRPRWLALSWLAPKQARMSRPRASDSTKSGPLPRPAIPGSPAGAGVAESTAPGVVRRLGFVVGVLIGVVEDFGPRQVRVHPGRPRLLAEGRTEIIHRGLDGAPDRGQVGPDQAVRVLDDSSVHQHGVNVAALRLEGHVAVGVQQRERDRRVVVLDENHVGLAARLEAAQVVAAQRAGAAAGGPVDDLLGAEVNVGDGLALDVRLEVL